MPSLCVMNKAMVAAAKLASQLTPTTPNNVAQGANTPSVWAYPMFSQGNPVSRVPRSHSDSAQAEAQLQATNNCLGQRRDCWSNWLLHATHSSASMGYTAKKLARANTPAAAKGAAKPP